MESIGGIMTDYTTLEAAAKLATQGPRHLEYMEDEETPNMVIHTKSGNRICFMATAGSYQQAIERITEKK